MWISVNLTFLIGYRWLNRGMDRVVVVHFPVLQRSKIHDGYTPTEASLANSSNTDVNRKPPKRAGLTRRAVPGSPIRSDHSNNTMCAGTFRKPCVLKAALSRSCLNAFDHKTGEETCEFAMSVQGENIAYILVRTNHDDAASPIDASYVENVMTWLGTANEHFLIISEAVSPLLWKQKIRDMLWLEFRSGLLKDYPDVDRCIHVRIRRRKPSNWRSWRLRKEITQGSYARVRGLDARCVGKDVDSPPCIGPRNMAKLHRLGICQTHDGRRMETLTDRETAGKLLIGRWSRQN